jgi:hypothetical protein
MHGSSRLLLPDNGAHLRLDEEIGVGQSEVGAGCREAGLRVRPAAVGIAMQKVIVRVVDDVLRRFQGMSADMESGSGDWMPKRPDPGEVRLQRDDLVDTALEVGDLLDLARAGAIEDELMVARDRERLTATPSPPPDAVSGIA